MKTYLCLITLALVLGGCASKSGEETIKGDVPAPAPVAAPGGEVPKAPFPKVTVDRPFGTLGELVRYVGETSGGGLVLMHGLETTLAPDIQLSNAPYAQLVERITAETGLAAQKASHYFYLYSPSPVYDPLLTLSLAQQLPETYHQASAATAFGGGTALYNVLASLSQSLDITLVADNVVSEAACGELVLPEAPLPTILEAVFKSALLPPSGFRFEATGEYVLILRPNAPTPRSLLLNPGGVTGDVKARLERRVNLDIAKAAGTSNSVFSEGALPLREVLPHLSEQLGWQVEAAPALQEFPVTWTVLRDVRVSTALELLIRQWPVGSFGYEANGDTLLIRPST